MKKQADKFFYRYMTIAWLAMSLLFSQFTSLHLHIVHVDESVSTDEAHAIDAHISYPLFGGYVIDKNSIDSEGHGPADEISVGQQGLAKKSSLINLLAIAMVVLGVFVCTPSLRYLGRRINTDSVRPQQSHFLYALLRAPPRF